jgi:hypothetical protein
VTTIATRIAIAIAIGSEAPSAAVPAATRTSRMASVA